MGIFNFNAPRPRQFNYQPRYYDERKERLQNMIAEAKAEKEGRQAAGHGLQPGFLRQAQQQSRRTSRLKRNSSMRLMLTMGILTFLFYMYLGDKTVLHVMFGIMLLMCVISMLKRHK